ncbi:MAG TPA: Crp/Fnr family transcriptional regulator [Terriglobales bacterium]|nr:Crp/Fnr family transcriptional regulator [Terriglobales bacterium]
MLESGYEVVVARAPFGLEIADNCLNCSLRSDTFFCSLPKDALQNFQSIASPAAFPSDAVLFVEGQQPRGIYVICSGKVKLSMGSAEGKVLILRIAEPGEVLGISATVSGRPYDLTAETLEPTQANFVRRDDFLRFLQKHSTACFRAAQQLSDKYDVACREIRSLGLSHSAAEKLALFLLQLAARDVARGGKGVRIRVTLTHEEIAQMIGTSRETVTRLLTELRKKQLIGWKGSILEIRNKHALQALVGS